MSVVLLVSPLPAQAPWTGPGVGLPAQAPRIDREPGLPAATAVPVVGLTVSDMDRSLEFYTRVLPFTGGVRYRGGRQRLGTAHGVFGVRLRVVRLRLGEEQLELTEYLAASTPGRPAPVDSRSNDRWFQHVAIIVSDMDSAYRRLRRTGCAVHRPVPSCCPRPSPAPPGIRAFYFKDPDGHPLEILQFPADKGDPKWHDKDSPGSFSASITPQSWLATPSASLAFYRDLLGLRVAGESRNFGTEQEHLNNVEGARLRITGLRSPAGPGIELLEYLAPTDGRPYPADERPNDLVHWQTTVRPRAGPVSQPDWSRRGAAGLPSSVRRRRSSRNLARLPAAF